jgi:hypothetical protein
MPATKPATDAECVRRFELIRDARAACNSLETPDQRAHKRETSADRWAQWFHSRMDTSNAVDPAELLPDALSRLEQSSP